MTFAHEHLAKQKLYINSSTSLKRLSKRLLIINWILLYSLNFPYMVSRTLLHFQLDSELMVLLTRMFHLRLGSSLESTFDSLY